MRNIAKAYKTLSYFHYSRYWYERFDTVTILNLPLDETTNAQLLTICLVQARFHIKTIEIIKRNIIVVQELAWIVGSANRRQTCRHILLAERLAASRRMRRSVARDLELQPAGRAYARAGATESVDCRSRKKKSLIAAVGDLWKTKRKMTEEVEASAR
ncbi:hypothetical protein DVH24_033531 [Malus domestica]|uniref:Uncharacterized protein n=1 Tax=Malus domestica TaxID=3750 RepID=A0A498JCR9_MALDO|nr:hypothetical protein DVH24_033531 [Malus domestica]